MEDIRYILGQPITIYEEIKNNTTDLNENKQEIGTLYPLNIIEYTQYGNLFGVLQITVKTLLQQIDEKDKEGRKQIEDTVKDFDVICSNKEMLFMLIQLISLCFRESINENNMEYVDNEIVIKLSKGSINRYNFDYIKGQILKMYCIKLPKQAKTKELQKWFDKAYQHKNQGNDQDLEDLITTIAVITGFTFEQISKMTYYQINSLVGRINKVKEYDTNVKFMCAGAEKVKLEPYFAHIDLLQEEKISTEFNSFKNEMNKFLKG